MRRATLLRTLEVDCRFGDESGRVRLHVGKPAPGFGAVFFQLGWLRETRGGAVEAQVLRALEVLAEEGSEEVLEPEDPRPG